MKNIFRNLFVALAMMLFSLAVSAQNNTIRVLAIGNSFSQDAVEQNLHEIASADGVNLIIGNMYIGGCSLERHYKNSLSDSRDYAYRKIGSDGVKVETKGVTLAEALADEKWDVVTFQQCSPLSGLQETYEPYLTKLASYVRKHTSKKVKFMFHQTWAYETGAVHPDFVNYGKDMGAMYKAIMKASSEICAKHKMPVIPCGTTIQNIRETFVIGNVTRDGFHLNNTVGRYAAACTWYEVLTGRSVVGNTFVPAHIWEEHREIAQKAAHEAVANPYGTTDFGYRDLNTNYDESKVAPYELPDALTCLDGSKVTTPEEWIQKRRPELLELFEKEMFGKAPVERPEEMHFKLLEESHDALGGKATRRQVNIYFDRMEKHFLTLLMYIPNNVEEPVPAFLSINFNANPAVSPEKEVIGLKDLNRYGIYEFIEEPGGSASSWPLDLIIDSGYAVATFYRGDIDPDFYDAFGNGIHPLFYKDGQTYPEPDEWGTIRAWAWGLSRSLDYLETVKSIDASKVVVVGHSRLGKTALLAGAVDPRFAIAVSNDSGCGGASLSRRDAGETVQAINRHFPHWFCSNFYKYGEDRSKLPFDQHEFIAMMAPRPVYVASATDDQWADPRGEFLSAKAASEVYELFGLPGLVADEMPPADTPVCEGTIGYHIRTGEHAITEYDWQQYIRFADKFFRPVPQEETIAPEQSPSETEE